MSTNYLKCGNGSPDIAHLKNVIEIFGRTGLCQTIGIIDEPREIGEIGFPVS